MLHPTVAAYTYFVFKLKRSNFISIFFPLSITLVDFQNQSKATFCNNRFLFCSLNSYWPIILRITRQRWKSQKWYILTLNVWVFQERLKNLSIIFVVIRIKFVGRQNDLRVTLLGQNVCLYKILNNKQAYYYYFDIFIQTLTHLLVWILSQSCGWFQHSPVWRFLE